MSRKKLILACSICVMAMAVMLSGCGKSIKSGKLSVVTTIFPEYDWTMQILGDKAKNADVTMLMADGTDLHSYQPSAKDIEKIFKCDVFVYVGGESDEWVEDVLKEAKKKNKNMRVVNLMNALGDAVKEEEVKEGMQAEEHEHEHEHGEEAKGHDHEHEHEHGEAEKDEHVWLSVRNAKVCSKAIADALSKADSKNADEYKKSLNAYSEKLDELDKKYEKTVKAASTKTLVFGDRFPFRYMVSDYGLDYYAAFIGCSAETEASFSTIQFLSNKVNELGIKHVMTIEKSDEKIAKTIIKNTKAKNQDILMLDSMQSTTAGDVKDGATYIKIMEKNLDVLKKALN